MGWARPVQGTEMQPIWWSTVRMIWGGGVGSPKWGCMSSCGALDIKFYPQNTGNNQKFLVRVSCSD